MTPYPLLLTPLLFPKVWGGDRLARFGKPVAPGATIGECWELVDMEATSTSGAGGGSARTLIAAGPLAGKTLADADAAFEGGLLGKARLIGGDFPLLVKFLDARENLSIQVHPSPAYARAHGVAGAKLKTECWYILAAEPGSVIYKGFKPGVTRQEFDRAVRQGGAAIVGLLNAVPAVPGACHNLPSGTVHALGAGVLAAEAQTPSDTTYRLYDWGRQGRTMHIEEGLASAAAAWDPEQSADLTRGATVAAYDAVAARNHDGWSRLVTTEFFTLDEARAAEGTALTIADAAHAPVAVLVLSGEATVTDAGEPVIARTGQTLLVPAAAAARGRLSVSPGSRVLRAVLETK